MREDRQLSPAEQDAFGAELDALRNRTLADLGTVDARYIRRIRSATRLSALAGRLLLLAGWFPPTWLLGSLETFSDEETVPYAELPELERWMLHRRKTGATRRYQRLDISFHIIEIDTFRFQRPLLCITRPPSQTT